MISGAAVASFAYDTVTAKAARWCTTGAAVIAKWNASAGTVRRGSRRGRALHGACRVPKLDFGR